MARRYKQNVFPVYDQEYDKLITTSPILNAGNQPASIHSIFWDKRAVKDFIYRLTGDQQGRILRRGEQLDSDITFVKNGLNDLEINFQDYLKDRQNMGFSKVEDYPKDLLHKRLILEAKLDTMTMELTELQKKLAEFEAKEQAIEDAKILRFGLQGSGQLRDSILIELDGQKITQLDDMLIIQNGPYSGMDVISYRLLCRQWFETCRQKDEEELKRIQAECKAAGRPAPSSLGVRSMGTIDKKDLPKYPENFKRYDITISS